MKKFFLLKNNFYTTNYKCNITRVLPTAKATYSIRDTEHIVKMKSI